VIEYYGKDKLSEESYELLAMSRETLMVFSLLCLVARR